MKHSYVSGDFYKLDLDLTDPNGPAKAVLSLITPISGLGKIVSEKGELQKGHFPGWDQNSLFHFIDEALRADKASRSEEHTSELQSLMRISYAVFSLKKKN